MGSDEAGRVFITGAASGLGRALALRYARAGWRVAVADVNRARSRETAGRVRDAGGEALVLRCDITSDDEVAAAADGVHRRWGGLDVLVNNAGVAAAGTVADTPMETWEWMIRINLLGAVRVCQAFLPMLREAGRGHVVNIASAAGFVQMPGMACYNVAKAGMIALSETLRNEEAGFGVGVTVVCPSFFATNLMESFQGPEEARDAAARLMSRSRLDADGISDAVYRAVQRREFLVFGHREAQVAYHLKRLMPEFFSRSTGRSARRLLGKDVVPAGAGSKHGQ